MHWFLPLAGFLISTLPAIAAGQATLGEDVFVRADKGNCAACHQVPEIVTRGPRANVGPALDIAVMTRWERTQLHHYLNDPLQTNPATAMPPFGKHLILEPAEIESVIDYLFALPARSDEEMATGGFGLGISSALDSKAARTASNLVIAAGRKIWQRKFANGRSLSTCFPNGGKRVAASYPQYDPRLKRIITLEIAINQCLKTHGQPPLEADDLALGSVLAYVRSLSNGLRINVRVPTPEARSRLAEGRRLYLARMGQQNNACATCHDRNAERYYSGLRIPPASELTLEWPISRGGAIATLHQLIRTCLQRMGAMPFASGSSELSDLEYYITQLGNGRILKPDPRQ